MSSTQAILSITAVVYLLGVIGMFAMHAQMPVTFGLAVVRSLMWPVSVARHDLWPRGTPTWKDEGDD